LREQHEVDPLRHCHVNVALYGRRAGRWVLTEHAIAPTARGADGLAIGRSTMRWDRDRLLVELDEVSPWTARPLRGRLVFIPQTGPKQPLWLDSARRHAWWPIAPRGSLDVQLDEPALRFRATGYHDANAGDEPLHRAVDAWTWSRFHLHDGSTVVTYVVQPPGGEPSAARAFHFVPDSAHALAALIARPLSASRWGLAREAWAGAEPRARLLRSLEDGPFYARHLVQAQTDAGLVCGLSETLSARRLASRAARFLVGFRERREVC
jgi:carotenoid 1,2-hydratase